MALKPREGLASNHFDLDSHSRALATPVGLVSWPANAREIATREYHLITLSLRLLVDRLEARPDNLATFGATAMQMQEQRDKATIDETKRATEYLANERTFLAWVRTSIAVISLGFVLARFSVWLRELSIQRQPQIRIHRWGISLPIGVAMMILGGALTVLAAWRYHVVNRDIERGKVSADRGLVVLVTVMVTLLSVAMIVFALLAAKQP